MLSALHRPDGHKSGDITRKDLRSSGPGPGPELLDLNPIITDP